MFYDPIEASISWRMVSRACHVRSQGGQFFPPPFDHSSSACPIGLRQLPARVRRILVYTYEVRLHALRSRITSDLLISTD